MERPLPIVGPEYKEELEIIQAHTKFYRSASAGLPEWQSYPEIPTARDLNPDWDNPEDLERINSLLPNNWQHPFPDKNTYLETHYRLQREEAIALLRYSVKKYRMDPTMVDDDETCVYTKVFVQGYLMTRLGPMCRIQFSTQRAEKKIRWTQTRRLTTGSLVAISTAADGFRTICMPAVVADHPIRDGLDKNPPTIQIFWGNTDDAVLDPTTELVMLESRCGYFEAVRHCMVGLQHVASADTPLDKYLVNLDKGDLAAKYVQENPVEIVRQRLVEARESLRHHQVLDGIDGEISAYTNLDNSQLSAVHRILTKELAIIQGPPGTGKTFTSVQALQILLDSQQKRGDHVIIVAAQTNHAVDQILSQLINLGFNTVRLGGRTQNEEIKRYSMYNLRCRAVLPRAHRADGDYKAFEAARRKTIARIQELVASMFSNELIDPEALQAAGIITQKQLESLLAEDGWAHASSVDESSDPLSQWLGDQRVEAPSMDAIDPDFDIQESDDTADFDAEDYDVELDDCIADDDENSGRVEGTWIPIKYQWTGANPRRYTEADLVIRKELKRENLWEIGEANRGAVYQYLQRELLRLRLAGFRTELTAYARICKNLKANRWHRDLRCIRMSEIEIIGCTTTGLCKYRGLLAALKPRTMLIEEAAETKEASILSALYPSLQQLILVGDHQQLKPSCDTPFLDEAPYNIRVSMFERLVELDMPYTMLNMQRRMSPVLREILSPFYPKLQDHPVVSLPDARPPIPGMAQQSFFFHHTWSEGTDENLSKFNILEGEMIVRFIDYLMMNGVKETEITVLTFYRGQRKKILSEFRRLKHRQPFKNVHTVDSYQGEENDIVILSLVRSNGSNGPHNARAGFLRDSNRGIVAISRARRGFYIFGNMINLWYACKESQEMWGQVSEVFRLQNRFGFEGKLPITCQQHSRTTLISHPDEWINHHGGCTQPCTEKLECGHDCGRCCHWVKHSQLICLELCQKLLSCGHHCKMCCGERCHCPCPAFTGAYPNDESWDDNTVSGQGCVVAPLTGSDGRIGRLRSDCYGTRGRRSGVARGGKVAHMPGREWVTFDAQQHDAQRRQEHRHSAKLPSSCPIYPSVYHDQDPLDMINEIYRQVTLNPRGVRNVENGIISENSSTPTSEKVQDRSLGNVDTPGQTQLTGDLLSFRNSGSSENSSLVGSHHKSRESVDSSTYQFSGVPNGPLPRAHSYEPSATRYTHRTRVVEDRPEWEESSTVHETYDGDSDLRVVAEEGEGNLIDF